MILQVAVAVPGIPEPAGPRHKSRRIGGMMLIVRLVVAVLVVVMVVLVTMVLMMIVMMMMMMIMMMMTMMMTAMFMMRMRCLWSSLQCPGPE